MRWPWDRTEKRQQVGRSIFRRHCLSASSARWRRFSRRAGRDRCAGNCGRHVEQGLCFCRGFTGNTGCYSFLSGFRGALARANRAKPLGYRRAGRRDNVLTPAGSWDVAGHSDPASWVYRIDLARGRPAGETRIYPSESVLHFRYAPEPERPWSSPSPLGYARATGRLAANLELAVR